MNKVNKLAMKTRICPVCGSKITTPKATGLAERSEFYAECTKDSTHFRKFDKKMWEIECITSD